MTGGAKTGGFVPRISFVILVPCSLSLPEGSGESRNYLEVTTCSPYTPRRFVSNATLDPARRRLVLRSWLGHRPDTRRYCSCAAPGQPGVDVGSVRSVRLGPGPRTIQPAPSATARRPFASPGLSAKEPSGFLGAWCRGGARWVPRGASGSGPRLTLGVQRLRDYLARRTGLSRLWCRRDRARRYRVFHLASSVEDRLQPLGPGQLAGPFGVIASLTFL
jgi:hypothetical protein